MGWEKRQRGGTYYVRKVRQGQQVQSKYVGSGEDGMLAEQQDQFERAQRESFRLAEQEEWAAWRAREKQVAAYYAEVEAVLRAALETAGYRQHHRGEWRKQRVSKQNPQ